MCRYDENKRSVRTSVHHRFAARALSAGDGPMNELELGLYTENETAPAAGPSIPVFRRGNVTLVTARRPFLGGGFGCCCCDSGFRREVVLFSGGTISIGARVGAQDCQRVRGSRTRCAVVTVRGINEVWEI
jgi:hypothetical protein